MNQDEFLKLHDDVPETVEYSTTMNYANEPLIIFEGDFLFKNGIEEITFSGIISPTTTSTRKYMIAIVRSIASATPTDTPPNIGCFLMRII